MALGRAISLFALSLLAACSASSPNLGAPAAGAPPANAAAASAGNWFEFALDGFDASPSPIDLSALNAERAGAHGFVRAQGGHFVDGRGQRVRFFGTNLTATACFPEKADAPKVAAHLRKLGFNVVRLHFMDAGGAPIGLFAADGKGFDPAQLDKLDFFVAELEKQGIYVNLNLHVARKYPGIEGKAAERFAMGKVLDRFYPQFVELQKEYARALLTHKNPYTERAYTDDPGVLCIELNNENTLFPFWGGNTDDLPEPFASELGKQWNGWLLARYKSTAALSQAWKKASAPGRELVGGADPAQGLSTYTVQQAAGQARLEAIKDGNRPLLRYVATKAGTEPWHLQFFRPGLTLEDGKVYTLELEARSEQPQSLELSLMLAVPDWRNLGLSKVVELGKEFAKFTFSFRATGAVPEKARLNLSLMNKVGTVDFARIVLREGAAAGDDLPQGKMLEDSKVPLPKGGSSPAAHDDYQRFVRDTERNVTATLARFVRQELKAKPLVTNTQANYGGLAGVLREAELSDFIDMHGYWDHPSFPAGWNAVNWSMKNESQLPAGDGGTLGFMAAYRVAGFPYTISEYNSPAPSDYATETLPLFAALAAFQDWDAIYQYTYLDFKRDWDAKRVLGFFDLAGHGSKIAFAPVAALAFRQGLIKPGEKPLELRVPREQDLPDYDGNALVSAWHKSGVGGLSVAARRMQVALVPGSGTSSASEPLAAEGRAESDTAELVWEAQGATPALRVRAPALRMVVGRVASLKVALGDVTFDVGPTSNGYASVALVALDGQPIAQSRRALLVVANRYENPDMKYTPDRRTVHADWGREPGRAEYVPLALELPGSGWKVRALDGKGAALAELAAEDSNGRTRLRTALAGASLWYALER